MATNTSVLRDLVGNAYLRQYGIDIISWPLGRFKYFANVSLDIAQNPRTYTLWARQFVFHRDVGYGKLICFLSHKRCYLRAFAILAPLRRVGNSVDRILQLELYEQIPDLVVVGFPGFSWDRQYFVDSTQVPRDTATRRRRQDPTSSQRPNAPLSQPHRTFTQPPADDCEHDEAGHQAFQFPECYYRTQRIEGTTGTL